MTRKMVLTAALAVWVGIRAGHAQNGVYDFSRLDPVSFSRAGLSGWQFLHLPPSARSAALANIKCGMLDGDASAVFTNPSRLTDIRNIGASFTRIRYVADIGYMTASVAKNFGTWGVFGISFAGLDAGEMVRTENLISGGRSGDLGTFTAGDILLGVNYARRVTDRLSIGGNINYIEENLDDVKARNWDLDFGVSFQTGFHGLRFDLITRNFGPDVRFVGFTEQYQNPADVRMPLDFFMGIGMEVMGGGEADKHTLTGYIEASHPNDTPERLHAALEYRFLDFLSLRGGYKFFYDEAGLTLGCGLQYYISGIEGRIDYAFMDYGRLNSVHLFTLGLSIQ